MEAAASSGFATEDSIIQNDNIEAAEFEITDLEPYNEVVFQCGECLQPFPTVEAAQEHIIDCTGSQYQSQDQYIVEVSQDEAPVEVAVIEQADVQLEEQLNETQPFEEELQDFQLLQDGEEVEGVNINEVQCEEGGEEEDEEEVAQVVVFECTSCNIRYEDAIAYTNHLTLVHAGSTTCCPICSKWYSTRSNLKAHIMLHTGLKPFECEVCHRRFSVASNLRCHQRIHTSRLQCTHCKRNFTTEVELQEHEKTSHHLGSDKECPYCLKVFSHSSTMRSHVRTQHSDRARSLLCSTCMKGFNNRSNLEIHMRSHTGEKPFACEECGRRFAVRSNLRAHQRIHNNDRRYKCDECGKMFFTRFDLRTHTFTHTGEKPFECLLCGERFTKIGNLNAHKATHLADPPFKCGICGAGFRKEKPFQRHNERYHNPNSDRSPLQCVFCGIFFEQIKQVRDHVNTTHRAESNEIEARYPCTTCKRKFPTERHLDEHERSWHKVQASFLCKYCKRPYTNQSQHQKHEKSGVCLTRRCPVCRRQCKSPSDFESHLRTHENERPYQCDECPKAFGKMINLRRHQLIHKGVNYNCAVCYNKFTSERNILRHIAQAHPGLSIRSTYEGEEEESTESTESQAAE